MVHGAGQPAHHDLGKVKENRRRTHRRSVAQRTLAHSVVPAMLLDNAINFPPTKRFQKPQKC
jgi:hypothetical protein